jgi:hypothetical protein
MPNILASHVQAAEDFIEVLRVNQGHPGPAAVDRIPDESPGASARSACARSADPESPRWALAEPFS